MKTKTLKYNSKYLPNSFAELENGYFKAIKSHTGSGGTTAILKSDIPTIIVTPNVSHVKSKELKRNEFNTDKIRVLFIYKNSIDKLSDVLELQKSGFKVHIYMTYKRIVVDSSYILNNLKHSHRLVADEYHILTTNEYMKVTEDFLKMYNSFKTVILTTATPPEVNLFNGFQTINFINESKEAQKVEFKQFTKRATMINQILFEAARSKEHTIIISNDIDLHAKKFYNNDNVVGLGLEKKIAIYNPNDNYKEIDYTKKVHVLSSSAWEGLDFTENCKVIIVAEYSFNFKAAHKWITKIDLIQSMGRARKTPEKVLFFYTMADRFMQRFKLEDFTTKPFYKETQKGIIALFSSHLTERTLCLSKVEYKGKAEIPTQLMRCVSQKQLIKNIDTYYRKDEISNNVFEHINLARVLSLEKDLSSSKGKQYGLNEKEACLFIAYKILKESGAITNLCTSTIRSTTKNQNTLLLNVMKGITLANNTHNFLGNTIKRFEKVPARPSTLHIKIANYITQTLSLETSEFIDETQRMRIVSDSNLKNQEEALRYKRDKIKVLPFINFIGLYNVAIRSKELNLAIESKVNEKDNDKTSQQLKREHKQFLIERLIAFNGLNHLIELEVKSRKYSTLTAHPKELRKFTTLLSIEYDITTAYPSIVAHNFSAQLGFKMQNKDFDIYTSMLCNRDEMKVKVNKALNQHTTYGLNVNVWRADLMRFLYMSEQEANIFINRFDKKGEFFEYATKIESEIIQNGMKDLHIIGGAMYRLHDAIIVYGNNIVQPNIIGLDDTGNSYTFKVAL